MPRRRFCIVSFLLFFFLLMAGSVWAAQPPRADQVQASTPVLRAIEPPSNDASADALEERADALRAEKLYLDALDYYRAALAKKPRTAPLHNKIGIVELLMQRWPDAKKSFESAIKIDKAYSDAYNNLGVIFYIGKKYGKAIDRYNKAIRLKEDTASYYSNLGAALFSKKEFEKSVGLESAKIRSSKLEIEVLISCACAAPKQLLLKLTARRRRGGEGVYCLERTISSDTFAMYAR